MSIKDDFFFLFYFASSQVGVYVPEKDADWEDPDQESFYDYRRMGKTRSGWAEVRLLCADQRNIAHERFG